jgi:hypothetical protein
MLVLKRTHDDIEPVGVESTHLEVENSFLSSQACITHPAATLYVSKGMQITRKKRKEIEKDGKVNNE